MTRKKLFGIVVLAALFALSSPVAAEMLTLESAVSIALENNRSLAAAGLEAQGAGYGQAKSISGYLPKVYFNSSVTRMDPDTFDRMEQSDERQRQFFESMGIDTSQMEPSVFETTYQSSVQVRQPIFNGGKEIVGIQSATVQKRQKRFAEEDVHASTANDVKKAFFEAQKAAALERTQQEAVALAQETLKLTKARFEVGQVSRAEVLRWESQAASAEGGLIQAKNGVRLARLNLNGVMGVELDRAWEYPEIVMELDAASLAKGQEIGAMPPAKSEDIAAHPSMKNVDASLDLSKTARNYEVTNVLPNLNFIYNYAWEDNDTLELDGDDGWTATVALELPLFQSLGGAFGIAQAHRNLLAAQKRQDDARRGFIQRMNAAQLNMASAIQRVEAARKNLSFAEETYKIVQSRLELGAASNIDLLDAQANYISAKSGLVDAVADFRIAESEWDYLTAPQ
ncbi:MAG: TolC family protein [Deltaproteobacteria bacterium]|nr:TolC family protein [Deltaproteobacteria bacterium]